MELTGTTSGTSQIIVIAREALAHMVRHRQTSTWSTEAGGQVFGHIDAQCVRVTRATGPYRGDERSRHHYRSNPDRAQRAIADQARRGLLYLGEWHTHAEDCPEPSPMDDDAMGKLLDSSTLNTDSLLLIVAGRHDSPQGFALLSVHAGGSKRWNLDFDREA